MAGKRVGLSDRVAQEVKRTPLDMMFPTVEEKKEEKKEEVPVEKPVEKKEPEKKVPVMKSTAKTTEKKKTEPKKVVEDEKAIAERCMALNKTYRKTFALDPVTVEALRLYTFHNRQKLSEGMIEMMLKCIPKELWVEARKNIVDPNTPDDYLDDVKKLDIDSIYYHKRKVKK